MNLVNMPIVATSLPVAQWVRKVMGSIPVGGPIFFLCPHKSS